MNLSLSVLRHLIKGKARCNKTNRQSTTQSCKDLCASEMWFWICEALATHLSHKIIPSPPTPLSLLPPPSSSSYSRASSLSCTAQCCGSVILCHTYIPPPLCFNCDSTSLLPVRHYCLFPIKKKQVIAIGKKTGCPVELHSEKNIIYNTPAFCSSAGMIKRSSYAGPTGMPASETFKQWGCPLRPAPSARSRYWT